MIKAKELLVVVAAKNKGDWNKIFKFIRTREKPTGEEIEKFSPLADQAITILDEDYPETWKKSYMPPIVLFYKGGEKSLLSKINRSAIFVVDDGKGPQVKKIIEDHGGKIWATSKESVGTVMYFVIRKYQEVPVDGQNIDS